MNRMAVAVCVLISGSAFADPYAFEIIILDANDPHPLGDEIRLKGVNNLGQVVGSFDIDGGDPRARGFVWSESTGFVLIGSPESPALNVFPEGIDDSGVIAATATRDYAQYDFNVARASTYNTNTGVWSEHHPWSGCSSQMQAMSAGGWFCGEFANNAMGGGCGSLFFDAEPFVGTVGGASAGGTLTAAPSFAHDVNDSGDLCGEASIAGTFNTVAYVKLNGQSITPLTGLDGSFDSAYGMNNNGILVGEAWPNGDLFNYAVKWENVGGTWEITSIDPGTLFSVARDINDLDNIVGWYYDEDADDRRGVIWVNDEPFVLDTLITDLPANVTVWDAFAISNTNWIIGEGRRNGERVMVVLKPVDQDTDGDGLLDSWEMDGIDVDRDGEIDFILPEGVDPDRKDILVEIDVMTNAPFYQGALDDVAQSFANAPVMNPDGSTGITAHFVVSDTNIPFAQEWNPDFSEFNSITPLYIGDPDERASPNWDKILAARQKSFRYCAVVNKVSGALGIAELLGNQMMIGIDGNNDNRRIFASTFMHELGHNLGLRHGGHDDINYKPNYVSCMNYNFDRITLENEDPVPLDYSRVALPALDEADLDETAGYSGGKLYSDVLTFFGFDVDETTRDISWVQLDVDVYNWNLDGMVEESVSVDLNWLPSHYPGGAASASPDQVLEGSNDWANIVIPLGQFEPYTLDAAITPGFAEMSDSERDWLETNLPDPPTNPNDCAPDLNGDTMLDFFDISELLGNSVDYNGDTAFDFFDISAFLQALTKGCP